MWGLTDARPYPPMRTPQGAVAPWGVIYGLLSHCSQDPWEGSPRQEPLS